MSEASFHSLLTRGSLLYQSNQYAEAIRLLQQALTIDPQNETVNGLLSLCFSETDELQRATEHAQAAIAASPDSAFGHYVLAYALMCRKRYAEADKAIDSALGLESANCSHFALKSQIRFSLSDWAGALAAAEKGLAIDAQDETCANLRGMALRQMRRGTDAEETIRETLARDPQNALSHANLGWTLLEKGSTKDALSHFQEALRLDPNFEFAREGLIHALRSKYLVYRLVFAYFTWISKFGKYGWFIIIGGFIGFRILVSLSRTFPAIAPIILPLCIAYVLLALSTWLLVPLTNLLVMLSGYGRNALSRESKIIALAVGGCLVCGTAIVIAYAWADLGRQFLYLGLMIGMISFPLAGSEQCDRGWPKRTAHAIVAILTLLVLVLLIPLANHLRNGTAAQPARVHSIQSLMAMLDGYSKLDASGKKAKLDEIEKLAREDNERILAWRRKMSASWEMKLVFGFIAIAVISEFAILGLQSAVVRE